MTVPYFEQIAKRALVYAFSLYTDSKGYDGST